MRKIIKIVVFICYVLFVLSCKSDEKKASTTKALEKMIQAQTGENIELPDDYSLGNSSAKIVYSYDGQPFFKAKETFTSNSIVKSSNDLLEIHFQIYSEEGKALIVNIQKVPLHFKLPLKVPFTNDLLGEGDFAQATMSGMDLSNPEASLGFGIPYEGYIVIKKMTKNSVSFEVDGKGGDYMLLENPEQWKSIKLKAELINPMIQTMGIEKSKIFN